ncbi:MAG: hypothetical protein AB1726_03295 [Planctomycetota bacterium]
MTKRQTARAAIARAALGLLVLGAAGLLFWLARGGASGPGEGPAAEGEPAVAARALGERRPAAEAPHAAPIDIQSLEGVELRWVEHNNGALQLLADGDLAGAVAAFEECHAAEPERMVFRRNLAEALVRLSHREHDEERAFEAAVSHLERAVVLAPDREDVETLRAVLDRWKEEWDLSRTHTTELSAYFEVSYDAARDDILRHSQTAIDFLDAAYADMAEWFVADPVLHDGRPKFRVVFYNHAEFDRMTGIGDWAGGVFDGTIRVSVEHLSEEVERWGRTLRHELVHAFVREVGGDSVPAWLNEGLAQFLDTSIHPNPHRAETVRQTRERLRGADLFPLAELGGSLATWTDTKEIARAYAQSLALVDFVVRQYGAEALRRMLAGERDGTGAAEAFRAWSGGIALDEVLGFLRSDLAR